VHQVGFFYTVANFLSSPECTSHKAYRADKDIQYMAHISVRIYRWKNLKSCKFRHILLG